MSQPRDGWDGDERDAMSGLEPELAALRRKHQDTPSLAMLRAADADALPPELQATVTRHLQHSAWSRAVVEGLRDTGVDDRLDEVSQERLWQRINRDAAAAAPRSRMPAMMFGGLALAATVLIAVVIPRLNETATVAPVDAPPAAVVTPLPAPAPPPPQIAFTAPDIKLSPSALTWRDSTENPFVQDLAPAFSAYRAAEYARAAAAFDRVTPKYANAIEVRFYGGVSHLLAGDHARAIEALEAAARLNSVTFADDVAWFLTVARQRAGNQDASAFARLCRGQSAYAAAACAAAAQLTSATRPQ
jgi:hypothetical protein